MLLNTSPRFDDEIGRLHRKFRLIRDDLAGLCEQITGNPAGNAVPVPGYERKIWKARMRSSDQQKGKSGGFRVIYYFDESRPDNVYLLSIYPKNERADLSRDEFEKLYNQFMESIRTKAIPKEP